MNSFNMESIIIKNTNYINTVTGSVQRDERKLKLLLFLLFIKE